MNNYVVLLSYATYMKSPLQCISDTNFFHSVVFQDDLKAIKNDEMMPTDPSHLAVQLLFLTDAVTISY